MGLTMTKHSRGRPYPLLRGNRIRNFINRFSSTTGFLGELHELAGEHGLIEFRVLGQSFVFISDPVLAEEVYLRQHQRFHKGKFFKRVLDNPTIITGDGDDHRRRRKLYQPAFSRAAREGYHPFIINEIEAAWGRLRDGEVTDLNHASKELMLNIANKTFFGGDAAADVGVIEEFIEVMIWSGIVAHLPAYKLFKALPLPGNIRYRRVTKRLGARIAEVVQKARQDSGQRSDLVSWLATATDEEGIDEPFTDEELRDEIYVLLFVSHDNSASALTWSLYYLSRYPETREKLEKEVDEVLGGRLPEPGDIKKLVYARAVFDEALRLSPPATFLGRETIEDVMVKDYLLPKGTVVHLAVRIPMQDERWFHDSKEFIPERWLEDPQQSRPRYAYAPFGGGVRLCSGLTLSVDEIVAALAVMAQRWRVDPVSDEFPEITDALTYMVKGELPVRVSRRPNGQAGEG